MHSIEIVLMFLYAYTKNVNTCIIKIKTEHLYKLQKICVRSSFITLLHAQRPYVLKDAPKYPQRFFPLKKKIEKNISLQLQLTFRDLSSEIDVIFALSPK